MQAASALPEAVALQVRRLGCREYGEVLALQESLLADVVAGAPETLLLLEHPPVYTLGRGNIAQAYDPAASKAQYKQAAGDITEAAARGYYRSAEALGSYPAPSFECGRFSIVGKAGESNDSILCVTTRKGKFLKLRLTGPQGKLSGPSIDGFISAWAKDQ